MNFDEYLQAYINGLGDNRLIKAMLYATSGGKHFRPELLFAVVKGFGISEDRAYPAAAALEMLHSYSLIHDDLPCMDNDDYRRGKLTVHKAFGEDIAVLCGDALLTHVFGVLANAPYSPDKCLKMISYLASLGGLNGMIYGQLLDISVHDYDDLSQKSGCQYICIGDQFTGGAIARIGVDMVRRRPMMIQIHLTDPASVSFQNSFIPGNIILATSLTPDGNPDLRQIIRIQKFYCQGVAR